jgi:hypothetical protein
MEPKEWLPRAEQFAVHFADEARKDVSFLKEK